MLWLVRTPLTIEGLENLPSGGSVLIANHSSYFDSLILAAAVPGEPCFVAKRELASQHFAGPLLRRLGTLFVERFDLQTGIEDSRSVLATAQAGSRLVSFPEGTFRRMPGLLPFKLGSFLAAAQAKVPIVPIALSGTRSILRANQWLPRQGAVHLRVGRPIEPCGTDWAAAVNLRDRSREEMLRMTGEPDLEEEAVTF
jgi:1-acyl-sn-glycerol-3-phosphate acyltransferase